MAKIYLISEEKFELKDFSLRLEKALKTNMVEVFQLRCKNQDQQEIIKNISCLKQICHDNNCLFILNDNLNLAIKTNCDGVHLGIEDGSFSRKNLPKNFIIGTSCYDSRDLALTSVENGADYISFGAFFQSKTKNSRGKPTPEILKWANEMFDVQICAIGGINDQNCQKLVKSGADLLSVISYIWQNEKGEEYAIKKLHEAILSSL
jgi:thiamine-phosphate pyrophosphorylase